MFMAPFPPIYAFSTLDTTTRGTTLDTRQVIRPGEAQAQT